MSPSISSAGEGALASPALPCPPAEATTQPAIKRLASHAECQDRRNETAQAPGRRRLGIGPRCDHSGRLDALPPEDDIAEIPTTWSKTAHSLKNGPTK